MSDITTLMMGAAGQGGGGAETDPNFNQTVLLLHGDGTNGAQNNTFLDSSTNNFTVTRNGNTTQGTFSPFSNADGEWSNYFDGSGDYLTIPDNGDLDLGTGDFSCELWCYLTTDSADQYFLSGTATGDYNFGFVTSDKTIRFGRINTAWDATSSAVTISNGWHHISATRVSGTLRIFFDGVEIFSGANTQNYIVTTSLIIASDRGTGRYVNGFLSNVRVVKGAGVTSVTVPTAPLTAISGTELLTCQSNRFVDNSSNAFAITVNGNTSVQPFSPFAPTAAYSASVNGGSGYFDGNDYLSISDNAAFDFGTGVFCIEAWVYASTAVNYGTIFGQYSGGSNGFYFSQDNSKKLRFTDTSTTTIVGSSIIIDSAWHHVVVSRASTGSNDTRLFVDGKLDATGTFTKNLSDTGDLRIGSLASVNYHWNGYIADLRVTKGSIPTAYQTASTTVGTQIFTPPSAPLTTTSQGASNVSLLTNFTNAGIFDNTAKNNLETVGNAQVDTSVVKYGTGSMKFDGTGDNLLIPDTANFDFGTGDFTIEFWLYRNNTTGDMALIDGRSGVSTGWLIYLNATSKIVWFVNSAVITGSTTIGSGSFYHIAIARSGTSVKLFVDGTEDGSATNSTSTDSGAVSIGSKSPGASGSSIVNLNGFIDDLRITNGVARYTTTFTPPTAALPDL